MSGSERAFFRDVFNLPEICARPFKIINSAFSVRLILCTAFETAQNDKPTVRCINERFRIIGQFIKSRANALQNVGEKYLGSHINNSGFNTTRSAAPSCQNVMSSKIYAFLHRISQICPKYSRFFVSCQIRLLRSCSCDFYLVIGKRR